MALGLLKSSTQQQIRHKKPKTTAWLLLFIVIAESRPVNKSVGTGAVVKAKRGTEPGVHKLLANYQIGGYKFMPMIGWNDISVYLCTTLLFNYFTGVFNSSSDKTEREGFE